MTKYGNIRDTATRLDLIDSPLFKLAEYKSKFNLYNSFGDIVIQQRDGKLLTIHNVSLADWMTLYVSMTDEEIEYLKENHVFSLK